MWKKPSSSSAAAVASGFRQYPFETCGPAQAELAHLADRDLGARLVDELRVGHHERPPDRALLRDRLLDGHREAVHADLREAVALLEDDAARLVGLDEVERERRAAADEPADRREVGRLERRVLEEHLPDRRDAEDDRAALLREGRPDLGRVEPRVEDDRPAGGEDRDEEGAEASRVVERREDGAHVRLREAPAERRVPAVPGRHPVRDHDALRLPGRPARVEEGVEVLAVAAGPLEGDVGKGGEPGGPRQVAGPGGGVERDPERYRRLGAERDDGLGELSPVEDGREARVGGDEGELVRRQARPERDEDEPRLRRREEEVDVLDPVVGEQSDAVPLREAEPSAGARPPARPCAFSSRYVKRSPGRDEDEGRLPRARAGPFLRGRRRGSPFGLRYGGRRDLSRSGGGPASSLPSASPNATGHSCCGTCPQRGSVVSRARGSSASILSA